MHTIARPMARRQSGREHSSLALWLLASPFLLLLASQRGALARSQPPEGPRPAAAPLGAPAAETVGSRAEAPPPSGVPARTPRRPFAEKSP